TVYSSSFAFFFQAEDGIRDFHVTGVQTCALPISSGERHRPHAHDDEERQRLPALLRLRPGQGRARGPAHHPHPRRRGRPGRGRIDRKSTRLNSSHVKISYAVFCLKKKKTQTNNNE